MSASDASGRPGSAREGSGLLLVLLAATGFGLLPLVSRVAYAGGLSPEAAVVYRFGLPAFLFLPFLRRFTTRREWLVSVATGLFMGVSILGYFRAIEEMPVAVAALIFFTFPLFAVVLGAALFGIRPDRRAIAGAVLVLGAASITVSPGEFLTAPGLLLHAFLAPAAYATLILVVSHTLAASDRLATAAGLYVGTALASFGLALSSDPALLLPAGSQGLLGAVGLTTIVGVLPQIALVVGAPLPGPARTAVVGAFELPTALLSGWIFLGERPSLKEALAGALILAAIALAARSRQPEIVEREGI